MMDNFWKWASESPYLATMLIYSAMEISFRVYNRTLRVINMWKNGYPTAPIDADGDVVNHERASE